MASDLAASANNRLEPERLLSLRLAHSEILALCELLEDIADSLPHHVDAYKCRQAAEAMMPLMQRVHRFEDEEIFAPLLSSTKSKRLQRIVERLRTEHCEDECYAEELSDALSKVASAENLIAPETLGYMLRGFFGATRRHIAFETEQFFAEDGAT